MFLVLGLVITGCTWFLSPFIVSADRVEHGWPLAYASSPTYTTIPVIGPLLMWTVPGSLTFNVVNFIFDVVFFTGIMLVPYRLLRKKQ